MGAFLTLMYVVFYRSKSLPLFYAWQLNNLNNTKHPNSMQSTIQKHQRIIETDFKKGECKFRGKYNK